MDAINWDRLPDDEVLARTVEGMKGRNFNPIVVEDGEAALEMLKITIPAGKEVMTGSSTTLEEIGFSALLISGRHNWRNWKDIILAELDKSKQTELRRKSVTSEYFLGSVQAITETGRVLSVDATGSRNGGYIFAAEHVIWVTGTNKIVRDLNMGLRRIHEHCVPLEDDRMRKRGSKGTTVGKIVIYEQEVVPDRIKTILIKQKLGF
jgi:hypothetical protein